ncbi:MAG: YbhB/YbcL family Raf kinase inhibitor-like protein [Oscillospiraceae bacterium]
MNALAVTSPAFEDGGKIPVKYTGRGEDISPELRLSGIDENARTLAVVMNDIDHPIPAYNHWLLWNIPVMEVIPEDIPHGETVTGLGGAMQGRGYGKNRYRGPKPPFNWSHRYQFDVYVLDSALNLPGSAKKRDLLAAMQGHILQQGSLTGRFRTERKHSVTES